MPATSNRQRGGTRYAHLYRTGRWQRIRDRQLRQEPLCRMCAIQDRIEPATVCDHVNGHRAGETEETFWAGPFQSLCVSCHSGAKAQLETHGSLRGGDEMGMSLDPSSPWYSAQSDD